MGATVYFIGAGTDLHPDRFRPFMAEEAAVLEQLRAQGTVKAVFKPVSGGGDISVVEAATAEEAVEQLRRGRWRWPGGGG